MTTEDWKFAYSSVLLSNLVLNWNMPLRIYAKSKFCVCFEVHIPVASSKKLVWVIFLFMQSKLVFTIIN